MTSAVQICPTVPQEHSLNYDPCQFLRRPLMCTADSNISHSDAEKLRFIKRGGWRSRWIPEFARNEKQLRKTLAVEAFQYCRGARRAFPEGLENDLPALRKMVEAKVVPYPDAIAARHNFVNSFNGGYMQTRAKIAWLRWRCGYDSVTIAEEMYMTPPNVRIILYRICNVARKLGFETFPRHHTARPAEKLLSPLQRKKHRQWTEADLDKMEAMRTAGKTWRQIGWYFGKRKVHSAVTTRSIYSFRRGKTRNKSAVVSR